MGDDEGNPFSFKTFVKRTGVDGGAKGGVKKEGGRKSKRPSAATQDAGSVPFPEGGENPFSFKKFVKKQTGASSSEGSSSSSDGEHSLSNSLEPRPLPLTTSDHPLSLPSPSTAPSTTSKKDRASKPPQKTASSSRPPSQPFPTKTSRKEGHKSLRKQKKKEKDSLFDDSDSGSDSFTSTSLDSSLPLPASRGIGPDPLLSPTSDDPLALPTVDGGGEGEGVGILRLSDSSEDESGGLVTPCLPQGSSLLATVDPAQTDRLRQQCSQLSAENKQLKEELDKVKENFHKEIHKNSKLKEQLQALKKKEAEETKALEDMVAKVEENLVTSTKRAANAEAMVSQLKQELQSIQVHLSQADAQSVHRHYEETLSGVRDKATYASRQLSMAAMAADQSIRELLSGVDTLKNVAEILQFIDRISEIKQH
jgi:transcriptional regulator NrdR family protein